MCEMIVTKAWCKFLTSLNSIVLTEICLRYKNSNDQNYNGPQADFTDWCLRKLLKIVPGLMPLNLAIDKSTLMQVITWCHWTASHYLNNCRQSSMSASGVTRPNELSWIVKVWRLCVLTDHRYCAILLCPDSKVHGANMGPTWVLSAPDGPHVGSMILAIRVVELLPCMPQICSDGK